MKIRNSYILVGLAIAFQNSMIQSAYELKIPSAQWLMEANALPYYRNKSKWTSNYMHKVERLTATEFKAAIDLFISSEKALLQNDYRTSTNISDRRQLTLPLYS